MRKDFGERCVGKIVDKKDITIFGKKCYCVGANDDTDGLERNQTGRTTPFETRGAVASLGGVTGRDVSKSQKGYIPLSDLYRNRFARREPNGGFFFRERPTGLTTPSDCVIISLILSYFKKVRYVKVTTRIKGLSVGRQ